MKRFNDVEWMLTTFIVITLGIIIISQYMEKRSLQDKIQKLVEIEDDYNPHPTVPDYMSMDLEAKESPKYIEMEVNASAYCSCEICCYPYSDGVTSRGVDAKTKGVAVDPKIIPYGSIIEIPNYGTVVADDTGGAMRGRDKNGLVKIDVRFKTHQEALNWGRNKLTIKIYKGD